MRLAIVAACLLFASPAGAQTRIALVVGVAAYDNPDIAPLPNALNDARAIHTKLGELGFDSVLVENPTRRELRAALSQLFSRRQRSAADVVLVFFAGHGVQYQHEGLLLARDSALAPGEDLEARQEVPVSRLLDVVREAKLAVLLLDACRNSPSFAARLAWRSDNSVSTGIPLLGDIRTDAVVSYSAEPGASALDGIGTGRNSPYATALLDYMGRPGLELAAMLQGVLRFVESATENKQKPVFEDRRRPGHPFYFLSDVSTPAAIHPTANVAVPPAGGLTGKEALALMTGKAGSKRGDVLGELVRTQGLSAPLSVDEAVELLGDIPAEGGRRRHALGLLLPLLETPISPGSAQELLSGLGMTGRLAALTDMVGCLARPLPDPAARNLLEGLDRQDMPWLLRELTSSGGQTRSCGGGHP